jgi:hypothetical protein
VIFKNILKFKIKIKTYNRGLISYEHIKKIKKTGQLLLSQKKKPSSIYIHTYGHKSRELKSKFLSYNNYLFLLYPI